MKCESCGFDNKCVSPVSKECRECNHDFKKCYIECKFPCRSKEEQEKIFSRMDKYWKDCLES